VAYASPNGVVDGVSEPSSSTSSTATCPGRRSVAAAAATLPIIPLSWLCSTCRITRSATCCGAEAFRFVCSNAGSCSTLDVLCPSSARFNAQNKLTCYFFRRKVSKCTCRKRVTPKRGGELGLPKLLLNQATIKSLEQNLCK
jgi:hypothetical protein